MINILNPDIVKVVYVLWYKARFLSVYTVIGIISIILEVKLREYLINNGVNNLLATVISVGLGITIAFLGNTFLNFKIPTAKLKRCFLYFVIISIISVFIQYIAGGLFISEYTYNDSRLTISGFMFMIGYLLHKKYTFNDTKQIGVAIYANGVENLKDIRNKIGNYPDYLHVDIVDSSFLENTSDTKAYRIETINAIWPHKSIHTHIMSKNPSLWLDECLPYSDIIYVHYECNENIREIRDKIKNKDKLFGIALTYETAVNEAIDIIKISDAILVLSIKDPGKSGQNFIENSYEKISIINSLPFRQKLKLCVDGGISMDNINQIDAEYIVSGSAVLADENPVSKIIDLQTGGRYMRS